MCIYIYTLYIYKPIYINIHVYIYYTLTTFKHTDSIMLDNLQEGFPWPARRFKHTESNVYIEIYI